MLLSQTVQIKVEAVVNSKRSWNLSFAREETFKRDAKKFTMCVVLSHRQPFQSGNGVLVYPRCLQMITEAVSSQ